MYGKFNQLNVNHVNQYLMILLTPLKYTLPNRISYIEVPVGFETDGPSIKILRSLGLFMLHSLLAGYGLKAHILHDYLYKTQPTGYSRQRVDKLYRTALRADGVSRWRAAAYYYGVRIGGWVAWNKAKKK